MTYGRAMEIVGEQQSRSAWATKNHRTKKVQWVQQEPPIGYGYLIARLSADMSNAELSRIRGILGQAKANFAAK